MTGIHKGRVIVLLDRVLASSYRLSIVTIPLTEAVWLQFAMQVFGGAVSCNTCKDVITLVNMVDGTQFSLLHPSSSMSIITSFEVHRMLNI